MKRYISNPTQITSLSLLIKEELDKGKVGIPVTIGEPLKNWEQLGYLHSTVLPIFKQTMFDSGEISRNLESHAKYHLKVLIGYGTWINYKESQVFAPKSFESATTEILAKAIDRAILECEQRNVYVPPPRSS